MSGMTRATRVIGAIAKRINRWPPLYRRENLFADHQDVAASWTPYNRFAQREPPTTLAPMMHKPFQDRIFPPPFRRDFGLRFLGG